MGSTFLRNVPEGEAPKPVKGIHPDVLRTYKDFAGILELEDGVVTPPVEPVPPATPPGNDPHPATPPETPPTPAEIKAAKDAKDRAASRPGKTLSSFMAQERADEARAKAEADAKAKETPPPAAPSVTPAPATPAPPAAPEPPKKVEVGKKSNLRDEITRTVSDAIAKALPVQPPPPLPPPQAPARAPEPTDSYVQNLGETEREEIELARYAEKSMPDRYNGMANRFVAYFKALDEYVSKGRADNPERAFDETDADFQRWQRQNRPDFKGADRQKLIRQQIREEAARDAEKAVQAREVALNRRLSQVEARPVIEKSVAEFGAKVATLLTQGEDPLKEIAEKAAQVGWQKLADEDPAVAGRVHAVVADGERKLGAYLALATNAADFDTANPDHVWINGFVDNQGKYFAQHGGDFRRTQFPDGSVRDFLPLAEFNRRYNLNPATANLFWTFQPGDIEQLLVQNTRQLATQTAREEIARLEKSGFKRQQKPASEPEKPGKPTQKVEEPKPAASPRTSPRPAPPPPVETGPALSPAFKQMMRGLGIPENGKLAAKPTGV
jgi:hypothetical protein